MVNSSSCYFGFPLFFTHVGVTKKIVHMMLYVSYKKYLKVIQTGRFMESLK